MEYYDDDDDEEDLSIDIMIIIFPGTQLAFTYLIYHFAVCVAQR